MKLYEARLLKVDRNADDEFTLTFDDVVVDKVGTEEAMDEISKAIHFLKKVNKKLLKEEAMKQ